MGPPVKVLGFRIPSSLLSYASLNSQLMDWIVKWGLVSQTFLLDILTVPNDDVCILCLDLI